jgi:trimeric autotransporter adhesin
MAAANSTNTILATSTAVSPYGSGYIFTASFSGFSKFFLVNSGVVVPVTLISFNGNLNAQKNAQLQWKVDNEVNLKNYEVERSYDGIQFTTAGTVAASNSGALVKDYGFTDAVTAKNVNYYRLKMIDANGKFKYSDVIILKNNNAVDFVQLIKNPVSSNISLSINNREKEKISLQLFNTAGQLVTNWEIGKADGTVQLPFNKPVAGGVYLLKILMGNKQATIRIVKE